MTQTVSNGSAFYTEMKNLLDCLVLDQVFKGLEFFFLARKPSVHVFKLSAVLEPLR